MHESYTAAANIRRFVAIVCAYCIPYISGQMATSDAAALVSATDAVVVAGFLQQSATDILPQTARVP